MNPTAGSRRDFIKKTAAAGVLLATARVRGLAADTKAAEGGASASSAPWTGEGLPWYRRALRWGQTNITERDVTRYDIAWWRDYWKRTAVEGVVINAGGIVAYYPSEVPLHRRARFLGERDLFGELCRAAHEDGIPPMRPLFVDFADIHFISALHGTGVGHLYKSVQESFRSAVTRWPTSKLTQILEDAVQTHQPPMVNGRRIKLRYAHLGGANPPLIVVHGNQTEAVPKAYTRYLEKTYRRVLKLIGTPIRIEYKGGENPFEGKKTQLTERQVNKKRRLMSHHKKAEKKKKDKKR